ncbi:phosphoribosylformylglycinamidine cyclo-ligase [candidate division KSB1 bacterium]|nr:phosphoribosylformylglycinamidine cyclo-ligase [candidate division KSB1 bacterium]
MSISYKDSGVDLHAAEVSTKKIAALAKSTFNTNVLKDVGLFSGFFSLDLKKYPEPVIVSSVDGVGTKLKIAFAMDIHDTIGQDLVNHCVNDIMVSGADPLFFLDYIGTLSLKPEIAEQIVSGMAEACKTNDCALIGGETAEMPGFYSPGEYDLAGTIVGAVNKNDIIDGSRIEAGDLLLGITSNGLHTNGYSLARKVLLEVNKVDLTKHVDDLGESWGKCLLKVHKSYAKAIRAVRRIPGLVGISHITGGGIIGNTKRLLRENMKLHIDWSSWQIPVEFRLIQDFGNVTDPEMRQTFNLGIGLVFVVKPDFYDSVFTALENAGEKPFHIGNIK